MVLIGFQFAMIGELYIDDATAHLRWIDIVARDHGGGGHFISHLKKSLILSLKNKNVCNSAKRQTQRYYVRVSRLIWNVPQMYHFGRFSYTFQIEEKNIKKYRLINRSYHINIFN